MPDVATRAPSPPCLGLYLLPRKLLEQRWLESQKSSLCSLLLSPALRKSLLVSISIKADLQYLDIKLFGKDVFLIIYLHKHRETSFSVGAYAGLTLASC